MPVKTPPDMSRFLLSPMPGLLVCRGKADEEVKAGQELAVVEAMKMENTLRAERDGVVARINLARGTAWPSMTRSWSSSDEGDHRQPADP